MNPKQKSQQITEDARVHYAVLKQQTEPARSPPRPGRAANLAVIQRNTCFLRTQQRAQPPAMPTVPVPDLANQAVLAGPPEETRD
jgi:hypothetical protein